MNDTKWLFCAIMLLRNYSLTLLPHIFKKYRNNPLLPSLYHFSPSSSDTKFPLYSWRKSDAKKCVVANTLDPAINNKWFSHHWPTARHSDCLWI